MPTTPPARQELTPEESYLSQTAGELTRKLVPGLAPDSLRARPRFFDGKFLTAADLTRAQSYFLTRQADLARSLGFGVVTGLRVAQAVKSESGVAHLASSVRITGGHGLTPAGEAVTLAHDLIVDLADVPQLERLNAAFGLAQKPQQPFGSLNGLFVLGLRPVEFTANPTPVFPPSLQGTQSLSDGEIIEATAITLVPYDGAASVTEPGRARARAARQIFFEQRPPKMPAEILPLAMICLRGGFLQWMDEFLVRREAGDDDRFGFGFAPRALAEAHFLHYQDLLDEVPAPPQRGRLAAADFFEVLPPGGPLPAGAVNLDDFTQAFFPADARVELALVPEDELAGLMEDTLDLPPLDLGLKPEDNDALAILVLAPVPRARYRDTVAKLTALRPILRNTVPALLGQQRPFLAIARLNQALSVRRLIATRAVAPLSGDERSDPLARATWAGMLGTTPKLWYMRRRNLPFASDLASKAVPVTVVPAPPARLETILQPPFQPATIPAAPTPATSTPATSTPTTSTPAAPATGTPTAGTPPTGTPSAGTPPSGTLHPPVPPSVLVPPTPVFIPRPPTPVTVTQPTVTQPTVTQPTVTQPTLTQPTVTQPTATHLVATTPLVGQPGLVQPAIALHRDVGPAVPPVLINEPAAVKALEHEGLWGRYAFLKAIADADAHFRLAQCFSDLLALKSPLIEHALVKDLETSAKLTTDSPMENFALIQNGSEVKVLTVAMVESSARRILNAEVPGGLKRFFQTQPQVLTVKKSRTTLAESGTVEKLAQIGLLKPDHPEVPKLAELVAKAAAAGKVANVQDAVARGLEKIDLP